MKYLNLFFPSLSFSSRARVSLPLPFSLLGCALFLLVSPLGLLCWLRESSWHTVALEQIPVDGSDWGMRPTGHVNFHLYNITLYSVWQISGNAGKMRYKLFFVDMDSAYVTCVGLDFYPRKYP